jgi:HSP20 family protein
MIMAIEENAKGTEVEVRKVAPTQALSRFEDMEHWFDSIAPRRWMRQMLERPRFGELMAAMETRFPKMDVLDKEDEIVVRAVVPGLTRDELDITLMGDCLTIKGQTRHEKKEDEKGLYHRREISSETFERSLTLPAAVDATQAKSSFKDGVLELTLPKLEKVKQHKISIG